MTSASSRAHGAALPEQLRDERMIGIEPLCEIIETILHTAYVKDSIPISALLIGPSGAGKSKMIMQYQTSSGCHITTDITSMGLQEVLARDTEQKVNFIVIPDFNIVLSHRPSTLQLTIGNLLSVTSEGTIRIDDGRAQKETKHRPVGILSALTRDMYAIVGKKLLALGFNRRFLAINYDYSLRTRMEIQHSIANGKTTLLQLAEKQIERPPHADNVVAISDELSSRIMQMSDELAVNMGWIPQRQFSSKGKWLRDQLQAKEQQQTRTKAREAADQLKNPSPKAVWTGKQLEFSPHSILRTLAQAHALRAHRREVTEEDIFFCMSAISFTRFDRPAEL